MFLQTAVIGIAVIGVIATSSMQAAKFSVPTNAAASPLSAAQETKEAQTGNNHYKVLPYDGSAIKAFEAKYAVNRYHGSDINPVITVLEGRDNAVLLSAPHAVAQLRNGKEKEADKFTGAMAAYLYEELHIPAVIKSRYDDTDPNTATGIEYKNKLIEIAKEKHVKLLLDLHGMADSHGVDVCLGVDKGRNVLGHNEYIEAFIEILKSNGIGAVAIDKPFAAKEPETIAKYVPVHAGIPSIEVEVSRRLREPGSEEAGKFMAAIRQFIDTVSQESDKE